MLSSRQTDILKLIVQNYIKSAKPISSKELCKTLKCSSATVRNEMAYLEKQGLIEKTHTSSGRVPSDKGYRYYVDNIMVPKELTGEDMLKLQTIFKNNSLVLSDAINKSMEIVSELTNYTAVVLGNESTNNRVAKVEVVPTDKNHLIALVITDKGHVENRNIYLNDNISAKEVKQTVDIINKFIVGVPLSDVSKTLEFEVKPVIEQSVKQHEALYNAFYTAFSDFAPKEDVHMSGRTKLLDSPEFSSAERMKELLNKFEDKELIKNIRTTDDGIDVYIGSENDIDDDISIIRTHIKTKDGGEGTIALIGPKRMEYSRAEALLRYIKDNASEL